jgi:hypothetical protein
VRRSRVSFRPARAHGVIGNARRRATPPKRAAAPESLSAGGGAGRRRRRVMAGRRGDPARAIRVTRCDKRKRLRGRREVERVTVEFQGAPWARVLLASLELIASGRLCLRRGARDEGHEMETPVASDATSPFDASSSSNSSSRLAGLIPPARLRSLARERSANDEPSTLTIAIRPNARSPSGCFDTIASPSPAATPSLFDPRSANAHGPRVALPGPRVPARRRV